MFKSVPGCIEGIPGHYGMFRGIMGCSRGVPGLFRAVPGGFPGVFRSVPGCSGFYRHPIFAANLKNLSLLKPETHKELSPYEFLLKLN